MDSRSPAPAFQPEIEAARRLGIPFSLLSYETLVNEGNAARTVRRVESRFFAMDVAKVENGGYMVVELGDGQVFGLPETADPVAFVQTLQRIHSEKPDERLGEPGTLLQQG